MKIKTFFLIVMLSFVLTGLMGCKKNILPETSPAPTTPYNLLNTMNAPTAKVSGEKGDYSVELGPKESKDMIGTFQGYLLATGLTSNLLKVQLIDITDERTPRVLRTSTFYPGTSFVLRQYFSGTKVINVRLINTADSKNTIQLKFQ